MENKKRKKMIFDLEVLKNLEVGVNGIAYTKDPAVEMIGLAFSKSVEHITGVKKMIFKDEVKMRISGPLMLVKDIVRLDHNDDSYDLEFNYDTNKALFEQLQKKITLINKETIFNDEHDNGKPIKSSILNLMFIESKAEQDYIKNKFNYNLSLGDVWIDTKVEDREVYDYLVANNKLGFSIEGLFKLKDIVDEQLKFSKIKINKNMTKFKFRNGDSKPGSVDIKDLKFGSEVIIYDEDKKPIENWSGSMAVIDTETGEIVDVEVKDSKIITEDEVKDPETSKTEIKAEADKTVEETEKKAEKEVEKEELSDEDKDKVEMSEEETKKDEMSKEDVEKEEMADEETEETEVTPANDQEIKVKEIMQEDIDALIKMIGELESRIDDMNSTKEEYKDEMKFSKEDVFKNGLSSLIKRNK